MPRDFIMPRGKWPMPSQKKIHNPSLRCKRKPVFPRGSPVGFDSPVFGCFDRTQPPALGWGFPGDRLRFVFSPALGDAYVDLLELPQLRRNLLDLRFQLLEAAGAGCNLVCLLA